MIIHHIRTWGDVELVALEAEDGDAVTDRAALAFVFNMLPTPELWSVDAILANWRWRMNEGLVRASQASEATLAHTDHLQEWIAQTRSIAVDLRAVYGDELADVLELAAAKAENVVAWPALRIARPRRDPKGRADMFLSADLWAFDHVREAILPLCQGRTNGIPGEERGRTKLLAPAINLLLANNLETFTTDRALSQRVQRLQVRPGEEDNLVADALQASRSGPYDKHGQQVSQP